MEYRKGLTSVFLGIDIEESEEPEIAVGLYDDGADVDMLAKSEADRSLQLEFDLMFWARSFTSIR